MNCAGISCSIEDRVDAVRRRQSLEPVVKILTVWLEERRTGSVQVHIGNGRIKSITANETVELGKS